MNYTQILELIIAIMFAIPVIGNAVLPFVKDTRFGFYLMKAIPLAATTAAAPREKMLETFIQGLVKLIRKDPEIPAEAPVSVAAERVEAAVAASKDVSTPPTSIVAMFCLALAAIVVGGCGPAQHPCVTAYQKASTEKEIAELDEICGHLLLSEGEGGSK